MSLILILRNTSALAPISNYEYKVLIGDGTEARSTLLAAGVVEKHTRSDGWQALVQRLLNREKEK